MRRLTLYILVLLISTAALSCAQSYLKDRGTGTPTSMFGTYANKGELLIYPFYEYYYDNDAEYSPSEFSLDDDLDYRGKYRAHEALIFLGYGISDMVVLEIEAALIDAKLNKADDDPTELSEEISESGLGDVQMQLDWRWLKENESRPEFFSYGEVVFPLNKNRDLIGTADWEVKVGSGVIRGFNWGTMTVRVAFEYSFEENKVEPGELAIEYLKRLSPYWRVYLGVEAAQDEAELIAEVQWHLSDRVFVKLNNAFALTSKATDWAPEIGIMFLIPTR